MLLACRVIALAWKKLDAELSPIQIGALTREEVERGLSFGGFAVFHCPLKEDSEPALRMLKVGINTSHRHQSAVSQAGPAAECLHEKVLEEWCGRR